MTFECPECGTTNVAKRVAGGDTTTVTVVCSEGHTSKWEISPINLTILGPAV